MPNIDVSIHLLIPLVAFVIILFFLLFKRKKLILRKSKLFFHSILIFVLVYLYVVGSSFYWDVQYQLDLMKYDLNGDGIFTPDEINPNQKLAMQGLTNDLGRNLSVFTGLVFSLALSTMFYWTFKVVAIHRS
ncbi:MAG: hypothetical protein JNM78_10055 [Cyclobacteriaceae bacterium]|nr:hypothetical protein [Cyclobacteriaceae bacterium]